MLKKSLIALLSILIPVIVVYFLLGSKYNYDVIRDYRYDFQNSGAETTAVKVQQGIFEIKSIKNWDTGFIKLKIAATPTGYFAEPYVEIISGRHRSVLSFERGVRGERYINLSPKKKPERQTFQLIPHHLSIKNQQASVILFNNPGMRNHPRVLVIAPHPDDAEIAAFGLYSSFDSLILTITAGEAGDYTYDEIFSNVNRHFKIKGRLRVWNSITVPMLGGVKPEHAINLGYFDTTLEQMSESRDKSVHSLYTGIKNVNYFRRQNISSLTPVTRGKADWQSLTADLKQIILTFKPDIIVTPYPALDSHPDHKASTAAVIEVIKTLNMRGGRLFLYANHLSANNYFPYGERGELAPPPPDLNKSIYFDSIYSFTLPHPKRKILALEAMNDLRPDTSWLNISGAFKIFTDTLTNKLLLRDTTYFRRAVRANELFLVVNFSSLYNTKTLNALNSATPVKKR
ncbi:MAG: PIG-L family deacetylase [Deltaproteobacteria bacterium]|nr:PIG-L family deacetylase [Deltaproteobacteria bacterium]